MTTTHTQLVLQSLDLDPLSDEAAQLRADFLALEIGDPGLYMERVVLYATHALRIGACAPADREPAGVLLT